MLTSGLSTSQHMPLVKIFSITYSYSEVQMYLNPTDKGAIVNIELFAKFIYFVPFGAIFLYVILCFIFDPLCHEENKYELPLPNQDFGVLFKMLFMGLIPFVNIWYIWKKLISPIIFYTPAVPMVESPYGIYVFMQPKQIDLLRERNVVTIELTTESSCYDLHRDEIPGWAVYVKGDSTKQVYTELYTVLHPYAILICGNPNNPDNWTVITPEYIKFLN